MASKKVTKKPSDNIESIEAKFKVLKERITLLETYVFTVDVPGKNEIAKKINALRQEDSNG